MSKLNRIKAELAKLLLKYTAIKTDKGILEYEGEELKVEVEVYALDENGERVAVADGEYTTEDGEIIVVANGKVSELLEKEEEIEAVEEDKEEEVIEDDTDKSEDDTDKQEEVVDSVEEEKEDDVKLEDVNVEIEELRLQVEELRKMVEELVAKQTETVEEMSKMQKMSVAKPASEEFEALTAPKNSGNAKVDKFLNNFTR